MSHHVLISVDELWLKGSNRPTYYRYIHNHIQDVLRLYHCQKTQWTNQTQRIYLTSDFPFHDETLLALSRVPGVHSVSKTFYALKTIEDIAKVAVENLRDLKEPTSFKVETARNDKSFPMTSMELSREIGHELLERSSLLRVDVKNPELVIHIRIQPEGAYVSCGKLKGVGGLPIGSSGHGVTLLSGGFDSPVASYLMSRRGLSQTLVFFHAYPFVGDEVKIKIIQLTKQLALYNKKCELLIVPFGEIQKAIAETSKVDYRTLFFRRAMVDIANLIAEEKNAKVIVTEDSLSQVSSQTIDNIASIDHASKRSIFRPLIGMSKREIMSIASEIGTHDISIQPHDDACALFAPENPVLRGDSHYSKIFFVNNQFDQLYSSAIKNAECFTFNVKGQELASK